MTKWTLLCRQLMPTSTGPDIEHANVAPGQELEGLRDMLAVIKLRASRLTKRLKPSGKDKIRDGGSVDLVAQVIRLAAITDLIGIQGPRVRIGLDEYGQVD